MVEACPQCGQEFEVVWGVTVGDSGDYTPVFGGPVAYDKALCDRCHLNFERTNHGLWRRQGTE